MRVLFIFYFQDGESHLQSLNLSPKTQRRHLRLCKYIFECFLPKNLKR